jgi:hypothetical protein
MAEPAIGAQQQYSQDIPHHAGDSVRPCHSGRAMMDLYVILKIAHVIGACVLFGTGLGIAFFMWMANRTDDRARWMASGRSRGAVSSSTGTSERAAAAPPYREKLPTFLVMMAVPVAWRND